MGASMSSSFLYRIVATVEIICSTVVAIFGVNTFLLFHDRDQGFQSEKEMIQYSAIVAVVQSVLTLFATFLLIGCHHSSLRQEILSVEETEDPSAEKKRPSQIGHQYSLRRKAIAPTWIAWTLISLACLLFVFISPLHYCIKAQSDIDKFRDLTFKNGVYETLNNKRLGICYSDAEELAPIRSSLKDLYSFSVISILFKTLFVVMVHRNWRSEMRSAKKIVIYVEGPDTNIADNELPEGECPPSPKKGNNGDDDKAGGGGGLGGSGDAPGPASLEGTRELLGAGGGGGGAGSSTAVAGNGEKKPKIQTVSEKKK